jgi:hypothetical protein
MSGVVGEILTFWHWCELLLARSVQHLIYLLIVPACIAVIWVQAGARHGPAVNTSA